MKIDWKKHFKWIVDIQYNNLILDWEKEIRVGDMTELEKYKLIRDKVLYYSLKNSLTSFLIKECMIQWKIQKNIENLIVKYLNIKI